MTCFSARVCIKITTISRKSCSEERGETGTERELAKDRGSRTLEKITESSSKNFRVYVAGLLKWDSLSC